MASLSFSSIVALGLSVAALAAVVWAMCVTGAPTI